MISKPDAVAYQLGLAEAQEVTFEEGGTTTLRPGRWVPELSHACRVPLEGEWEVTYWPFPAPEGALVRGGCGDACWEKTAQPGKLFYYDPEESPHTIEGWNRVTQEHLDEDDGCLIRREVTLPAAWAGKRILLRFEGIFPAGVIYWDGRPVGEQWSGLSPIEIDLTGAASAGGTHQVAVRFFPRHPSIALDMPRHACDFVGLHRAAYVHAVEPLHLSDLRLVPELADDYATGRLRGEVSLRNSGLADLPAAVDVVLSDAAGKQVASAHLEAGVAAGVTEELALDVACGEVEVWNAERPYLYTLTLRVTAPGQQPQEVTRRIGFRRFELKNERAYLNGKLVKFRGVNHLTFHPEFGLYTPEPWLRQCLTLMKRANVNAIRTHFFGPNELVDLCDELGIYLLQELPIDWGHPYVHETFQLGPMLHRMEACARRDRNHPAVMVWSIGNENMPKNEEVYDDFWVHLRLVERMVRTVDPTRPTMFPPPGPAGAIKGILETRIGDVADIHYSFELIRQFNETGKLEGNPRTWEPSFEEPLTRAEALAAGWSGVWFSSEWGINNMQTDLLNAPYTSIIADVMEEPLSGKNSQQVFLDRFSREWGYMRDDPTCLGSAYFPWIASGSGRMDGWVRWGEDADWGAVTGDLLPKPAFWGIRVLYAPVRFPDRVIWKPGDTELVLPVHNDLHSLDLADCTLRTQMGGGPPYMSMLREWRDVPMSGAPMSAGTVTVPLWNPGTVSTLEGGNPALCRCIVLDPTGFRLILHDVMIVPEALQATMDAEITLGPDAKL